MLKKNANLINSGEKEDSKELESRIIEMVFMNREKFSRPVKAFITFCNQINHERILNKFETRIDPLDYHDRL